MFSDRDSVLDTHIPNYIYQIRNYPCIGLIFKNYIQITPKNEMKVNITAVPLPQPSIVLSSPLHVL